MKGNREEKVKKTNGWKGGERVSPQYVEFVVVERFAYQADVVTRGSTVRREEVMRVLW